MQYFISKKVFIKKFFTGVVSLCTGERHLKKESVNFVMTLPESKFICSAAAEEVHIFAAGSLPEYGELFSVIPSYTDPGTVFTVKCCGITSFIIQNTSDITLSVNAFSTPFAAFRHLQTRSARGAHEQNKHHHRSTRLCCTKAVLRSNAVLRL